MSKIVERISGMSVLLLGLISVILVILMYVGGNAESITVGEEALTVPKFTDSLIYWSYFLLILTLGLTLLLTLIGFVKQLIENPTAAVKTLIPLILFVLVFVVAWFLGSTEKISIIGYEGSENQGFWAQFSDMVIYAIYALFIGLGVTIVGSGIYRKVK
ncbi:MAG: hypothetical protein AUK44_02050 [Porphyromonadaceae bacterium CG2_30_38_12]|nr:MAG: hypothetical protein AUK44_02050 [Porphyromonadaceae bacterium CG2_30_38_12]